MPGTRENRNIYVMKMKGHFLHRIFAWRDVACGGLLLLPYLPLPAPSVGQMSTRKEVQEGPRTTTTYYLYLYVGGGTSSITVFARVGFLYILNGSGRYIGRTFFFLLLSFEYISFTCRAVQSVDRTFCSSFVRTGTSFVHLLYCGPVLIVDRRRRT